MKKIILTGLFLITILHVFGQNSTDTIQIKKTVGTIYIQNGIKLTPRQLMEITKPDPDAFQEMKIAKSNYDLASVIGFAGGFLIGWPLGTAIAGGDPDWTLAAVGAGLIIVTIPLSVGYTKHAKNAVNIYNNGLKLTGYKHCNYRIEFAYNRIGIKMIF